MTCRRIGHCKYLPGQPSKSHFLPAYVTRFISSTDTAVHSADMSACWQQSNMPWNAITVTVTGPRPGRHHW